MTLPAKATTIKELKEIISHLPDDTRVAMYDSNLGLRVVTVMMDEIIEDVHKPFDVENVIVFEIGELHDAR